MVAPEDADDLSRMLACVAGLVRHAGRTYGDEIEIVVGPLPADHLFDDVAEAPVWRIGTQASAWTLEGDVEVPLVDENSAVEAIDASLARLAGARLRLLEPRLPGLGLMISLDDGRNLTVSGRSVKQEGDEELEHPDPPFWEVFTPDNHVIAAGPGPFWSRVPSGVPEREIVAPLRKWRMESIAEPSPSRSFAVVAWSALVLAISSVGIDLVTLASGSATAGETKEVFTLVLGVLLLFPLVGLLVVSYRGLRRSEHVPLDADRRLGVFERSRR